MSWSETRRQESNVDLEHHDLISFGLGVCLSTLLDLKSGQVNRILNPVGELESQKMKHFILELENKNSREGPDSSLMLQTDIRD